MGTARKFVDADLRLNPDLISVAIKYAEQYKGEFGFLLDARQVVIETGSLPLAVARGVLNCMRVDPMVIGLENMQRAEYFVVNDYAEQPHEHRNLDSVEEDDEDEDYDEPRRPHIYNPATVKVRYVHSKQHRAVLHRVGVGTCFYTRANYCNAYYSRSFDYRQHSWYDGAPEDAERSIVHFYVHRQCNSHALVNPILVAERPQGMPYCRSGCFSWLCDNCKKRSTLRDSQLPSEELYECEWCGSPSIRQEFDRRMPKTLLDAFIRESKRYIR